jgi:hypothetical protein
MLCRATAQLVLVDQLRRVVAADGRSGRELATGALLLEACRDARTKLLLPVGRRITELSQIDPRGCQMPWVRGVRDRVELGGASCVVGLDIAL